MNNDFNTNDDEVLLKNYLNGDELAFEALIKKYSRLIYFFIFYQTKDSQLSEDLTQETFIKAWKNIRKFDFDKSFRAWIFKIARNTTIDYFRKFRSKEIPFSFFEDEKGFNPVTEKLRDPQPLPNQVLELKEVKDYVKNLVSELPFNYQQIIYMHYELGLSLSEIAKILDKSVNTVKSWHQRALLRLKKALAAKNASDLP